MIQVKRTIGIRKTVTTTVDKRPYIKMFARTIYP